MYLMTIKRSNGILGFQKVFFWSYQRSKDSKKNKKVSRLFWKVFLELSQVWFLLLLPPSMCTSISKKSGQLRKHPKLMTAMQRFMLKHQSKRTKKTLKLLSWSRTKKVVSKLNQQVSQMTKLLSLRIRVLPMVRLRQLKSEKINFESNLKWYWK